MPVYIKTRMQHSGPLKVCGKNEAYGSGGKRRDDPQAIGEGMSTKALTFTPLIFREFVWKAAPKLTTSSASFKNSEQPCKAKSCSRKCQYKVALMNIVG